MPTSSPEPLSFPPAVSPPVERSKIDPQLLQQALNGDNAAFETLILTYSRSLYAIAYSILQNQTEAEDIVQETFLRAHKEGSKLREPEKFVAWLQSVTRNASRDLLRRRRPQASEEEYVLIQDETTRRPGIHLDEAQVHSHLKAALARLPEEHRTALTLRYMEGLDYRGIELAMGLSNGALRGIMGRALATLRRHLQPLDLARDFSPERNRL